MGFPDDVPTLTDGVVTLRAHRPEDVEAVFEQGTDPLSQRWTTVPVPYTREDAVSFVTEKVPASWGEPEWAFAVEAADDDGTPRFCGTVSLRDEGNRRAEIAYGSHPWARGRGVMLRGLELLLEWGFTEQRLRTVVWWANKGNWASRRTAWRLGFSFGGTLTRWLPQRGVLLDAWVGVLHVDDERAPRTPWLEVPVIDGAGVRLRPLADSDVARIVEAANDEQTSHWLGRLPRPYGVPEAERYLARRLELQADGEGVTWAVADPSTDLLLGIVVAFGIAPGMAAEIGYWTHPDARGRGVTLAACRELVRHCFAPAEHGGLDLGRLYAEVGEGNTASVRVLERLGFRSSGRHRRAMRLGDGSLVDALCFDLLVDEQPPD